MCFPDQEFMPAVAVPIPQLPEVGLETDDLWKLLGEIPLEFDEEDVDLPAILPSILCGNAATPFIPAAVACGAPSVSPNKPFRPAVAAPPKHLPAAALSLFNPYEEAKPAAAAAAPAPRPNTVLVIPAAPKPAAAAPHPPRVSDGASDGTGASPAETHHASDAEGECGHSGARTKRKAAPARRPASQSAGYDSEEYDEVEERRRQKRLVKNRLTAAASRQRKKAELVVLKERISELEAENAELKGQLEEAKRSGSGSLAAPRASSGSDAEHESGHSGAMDCPAL